MTSSINGTRIFRTALLVESAANLGSMIQIFFTPESFLANLVKDSSQVTPATISLTQWIGTIIVPLTVPLLLSYPNGKDAATFRKLTYTILGAGETSLGIAAAIQYLKGGSGMADNALLGTMAMMGAFLSVRLFVLFVKPECMEVQEDAKKAE